MFVGHLGVGFAARRFAPRASLGTLLLAATFADLLLFILLAFGVEHIAIRPGITRVNALDLYDYPWSHGLLTDAAWAALLALAWFLRRRDRAGAFAIFLAVISHWVLDWISHRPDLPLVPGYSPYFGLGLYDSPIGLLVVEGLLWVVGIALYLRATPQPRRAGAIALWVGIAVLTALWLLSFNGAPPPSVRVLVTVDLVVFPIVLAWGYWTDRLRRAPISA